MTGFRWVFQGGTLPLLLLLAGATGSAAAQDDSGGYAAVVPYRPSVSTPAQLSAPGQLELELGGQQSKLDDSHRASLPYTLKLAFSPEWGVLVEGDAYVDQRAGDDPHARGVGDTTLVLKRAFLIDDATAFGLELGAKVPTAKDSIGSGKSEYSVNGIFSRDQGSVHMDVNLNLTRLGAVDPGTARTQSGAALALSTPVSERWGATAELSGTHQVGAASTAQLLVAATFNPTKQMEVDIGVARGLNSASPDWTWFSGFVVPLARLW